jgi:hypothetical protein
MDIRANAKDHKKIQKLWEKGKINKKVVTLTVDEKAIIPVIMIKDANDALVEWTKGIRNVQSFLKYGYVRIIKKCPYQPGKCRGEKCQLFQIRNGTGDCAHNWAAIGLWEGR